MLLHINSEKMTGERFGTEWGDVGKGEGALAKGPRAKLKAEEVHFAPRPKPHRRLPRRYDWLVTQQAPYRLNFRRTGAPYFTDALGTAARGPISTSCAG